MRFMLLVYGDEAAWTEEERSACMSESAALCRVLAEQGQFVDASPLHPVATATSVRVRDGKRHLTDGPFAETTEQLGGFYIVDMPTMEDALAFAASIPPAKKGTVEVRPLFELKGLPE
ncbi:YCII-related domain protein [Posidoniimonas polymericola]|uniref:YCII-related domain protein n=1 Tax=Posidoniimonas polymericola TaxID=2528002 RepID=A0A5C5YGE2_9BACT|nr:YciI family protein [Posidoniimonas polymericola]TWT74450.1 YCII-related domain protein [Posidoniimonas polymericola]